MFLGTDRFRVAYLMPVMWLFIVALSARNSVKCYESFCLAGQTVLIHEMAKFSYQNRKKEKKTQCIESLVFIEGGVGGGAESRRYI